MSQANEDNLIWIDLEMTGLDTDTDSILEIATIVTDKDLRILAEGPVFAIRHALERLEGMDAWNAVIKAALSRFRRRPRGRRASHPRFPQGMGAAGQVADVRQLDLPGSPLPAPSDAAPGTLLPLPQSRRVDPEGIGAPLGARHRQGLFQGIRTHSAVGYP